jgi:hypothetical protein
MLTVEMFTLRESKESGPALTNFLTNLTLHFLAELVVTDPNPVQAHHTLAPALECYAFWIETPVHQIRVKKQT